MRLLQSAAASTARPRATSSTPLCSGRSPGAWASNQHSSRGPTAWICSGWRLPGNQARPFSRSKPLSLDLLEQLRLQATTLQIPLPAHDGRLHRHMAVVVMIVIVIVMVVVVIVMGLFAAIQAKQQGRGHLAPLHRNTDTPGRTCGLRRSRSPPSGPTPGNQPG